MRIQRVRSKWAKTEALLADPDVKRFVPETRPYSREKLKEMLHRMGMVYVKPVNGTFGKGVIRVEKNNGDDRPYGFQSGVRKYRYETFGQMFGKLEEVKLSKPYLVQQGIELLQHADRRFDLRLMVQHNSRSEWVSTGLIGRVAHPRKIVTNYHSGGTPMGPEKLFEPYMSPEQFAQFRDGLCKLGTMVASAMSRKYPRLKEIGIDFAIDRTLKPWILEVNTKPDPYIFRKLPDPSVFRRICRYAVQYGRPIRQSFPGA
ncbi:YheC/YheD family protein [Cohnella sp. CFH 77786]|uniref:YheC/YheD family protein n=1 Tax=Cohnella sp. CFH 77786 TaxID=2662265 RepID=UPI001C60BDBF|nr:YheC/YheD family protein [Cohnella sp. CFH 77786]MBW5448812.1 YheC/YheD family protein [Cohnella sp. CFH 77786]